jgi:hypothetical protein
MAGLGGADADLARAASVAAPAGGPAPRVEIVIPVRNEEDGLARSVRSLVAYLRAEFPFRTRVTVADNGSSDATWSIAVALSAELGEVRAIRLDRPGKGGAVSSGWLHSDAEVLAYTDVDLSSGLNALLPLVSPLLSGHSDVAIGTRLARGARVSRSSRREVISRGYNLLLHAILGVRFSDASCGFKAIRADPARSLLPLIEDTSWFFDTELLVLAERAGLRIHEVPVDWIDDPDSSVDVLATAIADLRGIARLGWNLARGTLPVPADGEQAGAARAARGRVGRLLPFARIGMPGIVAYIVLYLLLRDVLGAQAANAASLLGAAAANLAVSRRITAGIRGGGHAACHQPQRLIAFGAVLGFTSAALAGLHAASDRPGRATEVAVLLAAGLLATAAKLALGRSWVFRPRQPPAEPLFPSGPAIIERPPGPTRSRRSRTAPACPPSRSIRPSTPATPSISRPIS